MEGPYKELITAAPFYNIPLLSSAPDINLPLPGFPGPETVRVHIVKSLERTVCEREREGERERGPYRSLHHSLAPSPLISLTLFWVVGRHAECM